MSPTRQSIASPAGARSRATSTRLPATSIATTSRAAPRRLDRQRAGAAAGIEQAQPGHVGGQPRQQRVAHPVAPGAHRRADAADRRVGGQPLPRLRRGAVEIGLEPRRGDRRRSREQRRRHHSNPRNSKMSRSFIGSASSGVAARPHLRGEALVFVAGGGDLGGLLHLEQRAFLQARCGGSRRDRGNARGASGRSPR